MVDEVLVQTGAVQRRVRLLPSRWWCICCWPGRCSPSWAMWGCGAADRRARWIAGGAGL
ncbi:hypothetical protein ABZ914_00870 [Spirillospora sp. NPDC046719]